MTVEKQNLSSFTIRSELGFTFAFKAHKPRLTLQEQELLGKGSRSQTPTSYTVNTEGLIHGLGSSVLKSLL